MLGLGAGGEVMSSFALFLWLGSGVLRHSLFEFVGPEVPGMVVRVGGGIASPSTDEAC